MTISARSRKLLWGASGNQCAKCRRKLVMAGTPDDDESIIGDECHIVSGACGGPRYDPSFAREKVDDYSNLILLCKNDHKLIDDQESEYNASHLTELKEKHEKWVSDRLEASGSPNRSPGIWRAPERTPEFLRRVRSGRELFAIVTDACAYAPHYDDLQNETEEELVAGFLQDAQDWGELELELVSDRMRAARSLEAHLSELERAGFWVFGVRETQMFVGTSGQETDWPIAHVRVVRSSNPEIRRVSDSARRAEEGVQFSFPQIEVSFRNLPDESGEGISVSHITDDVLLCVKNTGESDAYAVQVLLEGGSETGGIMGVDLAPDAEVVYPLKRVLGSRLDQLRREVELKPAPESLELIFAVSYRSDKSQHRTTSRFVLDGSRKARQ